MADHRLQPGLYEALLTGALDKRLADLVVAAVTPELRALADAEAADRLRDLAVGRVNVVFTVDLFNEGVDVPNVDTLLLLRPTESPTLFLQQLGRGLRRAREKALCTVIDFVGNHRREFRFDRKLRALLGGTRREVERHVERNFPFLPRRNRERTSCSSLA